MMAPAFSDHLVAMFCRAVTRCLFRVQVTGKRHVPPRGPALLVANHLTYLDGFLMGSCLGPGVRFLVWKPYYDRIALKWGLRIANAIPICEDLHIASRAIKQARRELLRGSMICIFAEGSISRTGKLLPFKRGLEAIAKGLDIPIIPVHLGGLWESIYRVGGDGVLWNSTPRLRHPVRISFGSPLPASTPASGVHRAVELLSHEFYPDREA